MNPFNPVQTPTRSWRDEFYDRPNYEDNIGWQVAIVSSSGRVNPAASGSLGGVSVRINYPAYGEEEQFEEVVRPINTGSAGWLDGLQTGLAIGGLVPGIGEACDFLDAVVSACRGNWGDAAASAVAVAVPGVPAALLKGANLNNLQRVGAFVESSTRKGGRTGGISLQEIFVDSQTGQRVVRHTLTNDSGSLVESHFRRGYKPRNGDLDVP